MGPLKGFKIIEMAGIGPAPFAGMLLADMGAEVILIERKADPGKNRIPDCNRRGKRSIALNLKDPTELEILLKLVEKADALFEGFRPGVLERLGLAPEVLHQRNPKLVIGRMTGWGQNGPLSHAAGHDINYIALTGALRATGRKGQRPNPPLNLIGDYGGGAMFLVTGLLAALLEAQKSGQGQVVDAAMTDGSALLMSLFNYMQAIGFWNEKAHGVNILDSGAPYYDVYETKDGKYISIGAIEPQFYALLIEKAGLPEHFKAQNDFSKWPEFKQELEGIFKSKTREEWCEIMEGTDVCFAPVLDFIEAQEHPHNVARNTYFKLDGIMQPAPAPRFSRTASKVQFGSQYAGEDKAAILKDWEIN